jgi:hypothetical protein
MRIRALFWLAAMALWGCGSSKGSGGGGGSGDLSLGSTDGGANVISHGCVDMDGDGFGKNCKAGTDCNDADPTITDECVRCKTANKGCPCMAGIPPMSCDPHYMAKSTKNGVTGTLVCSQGTRYCRDGVFSDCEVLLQYAQFIAD